MFLIVQVALPFSKGISYFLPSTITVTLPVAPEIDTLISTSLPNEASPISTLISLSNLVTLNVVLTSEELYLRLELSKIASAI